MKLRLKKVLNFLRLHKYIVATLLVATLVRFYKLTDLFHWTLDEEFWAYTIHNLASGHHFPLIGGHAAGTGLYTGPFFVWLMAPLFFLIGSKPVLIAVLMSLIGVITTAAIYFLLPLKNKTQRLLATLIYALSPIIVIYDRKFWNASSFPLLSILTIYLLNKLRKHYSHKQTLLLALVLTIAFHANLSGIILTFFTATYMVLNKFSRKSFATLALYFFIFQTPLYAFEIRHDFLNTKALVKLTQNHQAANPSFLDSIDATVTSISRFIYTNPYDIANEITLCSAYQKNPSNPPITSYVIGIFTIIFSLYSFRKKDPYTVLLIVNIILFLLN